MGFFSRKDKSKTDAPVMETPVDDNRPSNVPAEAKWKKKKNEWQLGKKNEDKEKVGEWKWWQAPTGHLVCHTIYSEDSEDDFTYTRYHQDGTFSQKGTYVDGEKHGIFTYQKSVNVTTENTIPPQAPENVFKMVCEFVEDEVVSTQLFDFEGNELDQHGNLKNPKPVGDIPTDAVWNEESREWEKGAFLNHQRHDLWVAWHPKGYKCAETNYDNGACLGFTSYDSLGNVIAKEQYAKEGGYTLYKMKARRKDGFNDNFPTEDQGVAANVAQLEYLYNEHGYMKSWNAKDENGNVIEDNALYNNLDNRIPQTKFASFEAASKVWNEKHDEFYKNMNWWLSQYYSQSHNVPKGTPEPKDSRSDMERVVLEAIETFNKEGNPAKARELFKPSYEPISKYAWDGFGKKVNMVVALDAETVLTKTDGVVYLCQGDTITAQPELIAVGASKNKNFVAKGNNEKVTVTKGWNGETVATFEYPKQYHPSVYTIYSDLNTDSFIDPKNMGIQELKVSSDGQQVLLISAEGVYLLTNKGTEQLAPQPPKLKQLADRFNQRTGNNISAYLFDIRMDYINADFSVDDKYIVVGGKIPSPILGETYLFKNQAGNITLLKSSEQDAMFGITNEFHPNGEDMLHAACLYGSINTNMSRTMPNLAFRMAVSSLEDGQTELDDFAGGYRQAPGMVLSAAPIGDGFGLGVDGGYVWWHGPNANHLGHTHIGGAVTAMDVTADKQYLVVGTSQGQVIKFKFIEERGTGMITDMKLKDEKRYLFFRSFEPMVW